MKNIFNLFIGTAVLTFQVPALYAQSGTVLNQQYVNGAGGGAQTYLIASTAPDGAGDYDHLHLVATFSCDDYSNCNSTIDATFGNRGGFTGIYTVRGASTQAQNVRLVAYRQPDNTTNIYLVLNDFWDVATYSILENIQDTAYASPVNTGGATPSGTLVFDTSSSSYPPQNFADLQGNFMPSGRVGIGTTNPQAPLDITGTLNLGPSNEITDGSSPQLSEMITFAGDYAPNGMSAGYSQAGRIIGGTYGQWSYQTGSEIRLNGIANPAVFAGNMFGAGNLEFFTTQGGATGGYSYTTSTIFNNGGTSVGPFMPIPSELRMVIDNYGRVGIGTATPGSLLEVNGSAKVDGSMSVSSLTFSDGTSLSTASGLGSSISQSGGTTTVNGTLAVTSAGNVGIGTASIPSVLTIANPAQDNSGSWSNGILFVDTVYGATNPWAHAAIYTSGSSGYNGDLIFATDGDNQSNINPTEKLRIKASGNIGIGTSTPGSTLEVNGNVKLTSGSGASISFADGTVQSTAWNGTTLGGDYAESVDVTGERTNYESGDVISINAASPGKFFKSSMPYSKLVAGVFSTKPGLVGRRTTFATVKKDAEVPMAMMGIVPTKVTTENGPVEPGDLLVSSSTPGYAMKATDPTRTMGAVIGKALAPLKSGSGVIEVLISLQ